MAFPIGVEVLDRNEITKCNVTKPGTESAEFCIIVPIRQYECRPFGGSVSTQKTNIMTVRGVRCYLNL